MNIRFTFTLNVPNLTVPHTYENSAIDWRQSKGHIKQMDVL
jgi:hypothetical protein